MSPLTQSGRVERVLQKTHVRRPPVAKRPTTWLLLGLGMIGAVLLRRSAASRHSSGAVAQGGATDEQVARIRETADNAQELPLP